MIFGIKSWSVLEEWFCGMRGEEKGKSEISVVEERLIRDDDGIDHGFEGNEESLVEGIFD